MSLSEQKPTNLKLKETGSYNLMRDLFLSHKKIAISWNFSVSNADRKAKQAIDLRLNQIVPSYSPPSSKTAILSTNYGYSFNFKIGQIQQDLAGINCQFKLFPKCLTTIKELQEIVRSMCMDKDGQRWLKAMISTGLDHICSGFTKYLLNEQKWKSRLVTNQRNQQQMKKH